MCGPEPRILGTLSLKDCIRYCIQMPDGACCLPCAHGHADVAGIAQSRAASVFRQVNMMLGTQDLPMPLHRCTSPPLRSSAPPRPSPPSAKGIARSPAGVKAARRPSEVAGPSRLVPQNMEVLPDNGAPDQQKQAQAAHTHADKPANPYRYCFIEVHFAGFCGMQPTPNSHCGNACILEDAADVQRRGSRHCRL